MFIVETAFTEKGKTSRPEELDHPLHLSRAIILNGIVKLSAFDQKFGNTGIHNSLIVQYSGSGPEVENQSNLT